MIHRVAIVVASLVFVACSGGETPTGGGTGSGDDGGSSGSSGSGSSGGSSSSGSGGGGTSSSSGGGSTSSSGSGGSSGGGSGSGGSSGSSSGSASSSGSGSSSGGSSSGCMVASDCTGGQVCCATVPVTGGSPPNCTTGTLTSKCTTASACPTKIAGLMCSGTEQLQLCSGAGQCTNAGSGNNKCCTFTQDGGSISFCTNGLVGAGGGGTCM